MIICSHANYLVSYPTLIWEGLVVEFVAGKEGEEEVDAACPQFAAVGNLAEVGIRPVAGTVLAVAVGTVLVVAVGIVLAVAVGTVLVAVGIGPVAVGTVLAVVGIVAVVGTGLSVVQ